MTPAALRARLHGVIAFPVTPFRDDLTLDIAALETNVRALAVHPLAAIVAAGGTGELYSLTPEEHLQVVATVIAEAGTIPVIAGVGFNGPAAATLARNAADAGASGILAFPPYYPTPEEDGIHDHYRGIAEATPLGVLIYSRDWFHPGPAFVERLATLPSIIAWKDGQGDIRRLQFLQARVGDRLVWVGGAGDDMVPAYYSIGIRSFTSSISNVAPALAVQLHETAAAGDSVTLQRLMREYVIPLYAFRARRRGYEVSAVKGLMNILGMRGGRVRPPLTDLTEADLAELRTLAAAWTSVRS
jgi:5-dehydro-4-deoxyglucarate dehydratase